MTRRLEGDQIILGPTYLCIFYSLGSDLCCFLRISKGMTRCVWLVGAATSVIFVTTKVLLQQNTCHTKMPFVRTKITFVATNTCGLPRAFRSMFVETKLLSQQTHVWPTYFWAYDNVQVGQSNIATGTIKMALFLLQVARGCVRVYPGMPLFCNLPLHVQEVSGFCCCLFVIFGGWLSSCLSKDSH